MPRRNDPRRKVLAWHAKLLAMLPIILRYARRAFRGYDPEAKQEAPQNVLANTTAAVAGLAKRGKLDVLSKYCQQEKGVVVERLDHFNEKEDCWEEAVVVDTRSLPVPEVVAFRVDFKDRLKRLPSRDRRIAKYLSLRHRTRDAASKFNVSEGRISQLRKEFFHNWRRFVGDEGDAAAAAA